jgi:hypothetical protein
MRLATAAGWTTIPSWYLISNQGNAIRPEAEVLMAERLSPTTEHVCAYAAFVAQPPVAAALIADVAEEML